jgi:Flp pilus assembly protein TadB
MPVDDAPYASFVADSRSAEPSASDTAPPRMGERACDELPAGVGWMIVGSYVAILAAFGWAFLGAGDVQFNLGVCAVYLAMYLGVPWVLLKAETRGRAIARPDLADFLNTGLSTWTGHVPGKAALAQILTIPVALVFAALGIGLIIRSVA